MVRIFSTGSWDVSRRDFDGKSPTGVSDLTSEGFIETHIANVHSGDRIDRQQWRPPTRLSKGRHICKADRVVNKHSCTIVCLRQTEWQTNNII